jgi:hypothetical protein
LQWGIVDVKGWLKTLPRGTLKQWEAFDRVEPIGEHWRQTADLKSMLSQIIGLIYAYMSGETLKASSSDDAMPSRYIPRQKPRAKEKPATPKAEFASIARHLGFKGLPNGEHDKPS